jgi:anti-sigma regulatory factor (Ser/Thr protein kinase)
MVDFTHTSFNASDRSYYAIIKKEAHSIATAAGFDQKRIAELDIVVAEMTSNLHKYATGGEILLGLIDDGEKEYVEVISVDEGPGMSDLSRMMADGFSTTNTMGHGLGSIKRLSDEFDIYTQKGWGTVVLSRVYKKPPLKPKGKPGNNFNLKALVVAKPGEITSGDGYYVKMAGNNIKVILADGLGHGPEANFAINEAVKAFKLCPYDSPVEIIRYVHKEVRKTRGLVATLAVFDFVNKQIRIAGVGNIASKLSGFSQVKSHLAYNGIIGHNIPNTMNDTVINFNQHNQLIMCSDGIRSRWEVNKLPGIIRCDGTIQAAAIYKDFARRTDDMSVLITKV